MGKKAILFVMTDDTRNCDDVAQYLEGNYPDLKEAVPVIHTKKTATFPIRKKYDYRKPNP